MSIDTATRVEHAKMRLEEAAQYLASRGFSETTPEESASSPPDELDGQRKFIYRGEQIALSYLVEKANGSTRIIYAVHRPSKLQTSCIHEHQMLTDRPREEGPLWMFTHHESFLSPVKHMVKLVEEDNPANGPAAVQTQPARNCGTGKNPAGTAPQAYRL